MLLKELISELRGYIKVALLDGRIKHLFDENNQESKLIFVQASLITRVLEFWKLASGCEKGQILFCFNSLPPLKKCRGYVIVYVHSPHFANTHIGVKYQFKVRLRLFFERFWFKLFWKNADEIWVQTAAVSSAMKSQFRGMKIRQVPFVDNQLNKILSQNNRQITPFPFEKSDQRYKFFYPADGVGHKNHVALLKAWELLSQRGLSPVLTLTLSQSEFDRLVNKSGIIIADNLDIQNVGHISRGDVLSVLSSSSALIFPSLAETLGLPLLEATALGVPIVASEFDYVRDIASPIETFNPHSPVSIADAVQRFVGFERALDTKFFSAKDFVAEILSVNERF